MATIASKTTRSAGLRSLDEEVHLVHLRQPQVAAGRPNCERDIAHQPRLDPIKPGFPNEAAGRTATSIDEAAAGGGEVPPYVRLGRSRCGRRTRTCRRRRR